MAGDREDGPLVTEARAGSEAAWRDLYVLHHRRLVVWLGTMSTGDASAGPEDIAAEAWMVAAGKIGEFRGSDSDFGGWLVAIARNVMTNHARRSARRRTNATDEVPEPEQRATALDDVVAEQAWTRDLLARLSRREAEVIACIDVVGLDVAATARALGMSPTAVRVARHRGLGRLRKLMARTDPPDVS